ncbi:MAG: hydrogenase, partial [Dehalococcoidia bacterium]
MKIVKLPKENLVEFIGRLSLFGEIHAPTKRGERSFVFAPVRDLSEIELNYTRTILPLKKYF